MQCFAWVTAKQCLPNAQLPMPKATFTELGVYLQHEKGTSFGRSLPVQSIIRNTPPPLLPEGGSGSARGKAWNKERMGVGTPVGLSSPPFHAFFRAFFFFVWTAEQGEVGGLHIKRDGGARRILWKKAPKGIKFSFYGRGHKLPLRATSHP